MNFHVARTLKSARNRDRLPPLPPRRQPAPTSLPDLPAGCAAPGTSPSNRPNVRNAPIPDPRPSCRPRDDNESSHVRIRARPQIHPNLP